MTKNNYQPGNEDRIEGQPDHQAKDDHTDANRPDRLQADNCVVTIKAESETDDEYFDYWGSPGQGRFEIYGLNLPDPVLEKVYHLNAERMFHQFKGLPTPKETK